MHYGEKQVVSMVLLSAYANFQDRLLLALNLPVETGGPLPPLQVGFAPDAFSLFPPQQPPSTAAPLPEAVGIPSLVADPEWLELDYEALQTRLDQQRRRKSRLPIPAWEDVKKGLPPEYSTQRPIAIAWTLMSLGYAPELAVPWNVATRTFWAESLEDRVYEESLFWIQTRVLNCNYCMGHCEMLMEVAGLDEPSIRRRIRHLASGDWTSFPPEEHLAYAFACLLTRAPWEVNDADMDAVKRELGQRRALFTVWWLSRGLYMTRVSDGFQLPLERENVFKTLFTGPISTANRLLSARDEAGSAPA